MDDTPKQALEIEVHISADDDMAACNALRGLLHSWERPRSSDGAMVREVTSGGTEYGYWVRIERRPEQTPEKYSSDLQRWKAAYDARQGQ